LWRGALSLIELNRQSEATFCHHKHLFHCYLYANQAKKVNIFAKKANTGWINIVNNVELNYKKCNYCKKVGGFMVVKIDYYLSQWINKKELSLFLVCLV